ncbi:unnamed protein product, partial [marine sediment metagenome]
MRWVQLLLKGGLDLIAGAFGFFVLAIPSAIIAIAIKLNSNGSVFFRQERVEKNGRSFK